MLSKKNIFILIFYYIFFMVALINYSFSNEYFVYNNVDDKKYSFKVGIWNTKLTGTTFAASNNFTTSLEDDLGFGNNKSGLYLDFDYKLSNVNTIGFSYFNVEHKAVKTLLRNITLPAEPLDVNINANVTVFSTIKNSYFDLFYKRYFVTQDNYDFYFMGGLRLNDFNSDYSSNVPLVSFEGNSTSLFLGLGGNFSIGSNLSTFYEVKGLSISLKSDSKNNFLEYKLGLGYRLTDNWNFNVGYRYLSTKFEDDVNRNTDLKLKGLMFGVNLKF